MKRLVERQKKEAAMQMVSRRRRGRAGICSLIFAVVSGLTFAVSARAGVQGVGPSCLGDVSGIALNCTAEDVRVAETLLIEEVDGCSSAADTATVKLLANLEINAAQRYDIAFYVATDGGNAQNGICFKEYLPPALVAAPTDAELASGYGSYWNGGADADDCGDAEQNDINVNPVARILSEPTNSAAFESVVLPCRDSDDNGFLDFDYCSGWRNNTKFVCGDISQAGIVQTSAKCKCGTLEIPVAVPGPASPPTLVLTKTVMAAGGTCGVDDRDALNVEVGASVEYCYTLENTSLTPAYEVTLEDDNATGDPADDFTIALSGLTDIAGDSGILDLAAGGVATGQSAPKLISAIGAYENTATARAVDPNDVLNVIVVTDTALVTAIDPCDRTNTACATGTSSGSSNPVGPTCDSVSICLTRLEPSLSVTKTVMPVSGTCGQDDVELLTITPGGSVRYCYVISAGGDPATHEAVYDVSLVDDNATPADPSDDFYPATTGLVEIEGDGDSDDLVAGGTAYAVSAPILVAAPGTKVNTAAVSGVSPIDGSPLSDADPATVTAEIFAASISVAKTAMVAPGTCGVDDVEPGTILTVDTTATTVTYCYVVTASGSPATHEPIYNLTIVDDNGTPGDPGDDFSVTLTSGVQDLDGGGQLNDLQPGGVARGEFTRTVP